MFLGILEDINKILGYLNISTKYLNRMYTLLVLIPTSYLLKIIYNLFITHDYVQFYLYIFGLLILLYFWILNFLYYFCDKNVRWDITQLLARKLPDEAFALSTKSESKRISGEVVHVEYTDEASFVIPEVISELIKKGIIVTNNTGLGFLIRKHTLMPYYSIQKTNDYYKLFIGTSYSDLKLIGTIKEQAHFIGLYIQGGPYIQGGIQYYQPYSLKLMKK